MGHLQKIGKTMTSPISRRVGSKVGLTTSTDWKVVRFWKLCVETKKKVSPLLMVKFCGE